MAENKVHRLQEEIRDLAEKATYYNKQIVFHKKNIGDDPVHTRAMYKWEDSWDNVLPPSQHHYAYYLFYKTALKRVEKELAKRRQYLEEEQRRANLPVRKTVKK
jgi:hypothetical protein